MTEILVKTIAFLAVACIVLFVWHTIIGDDDEQ